MKKAIFLTLIASLCLAIGLPLMAADTGQINYQARLLDSYGRRLNTTVDLSFKIYDAATAGNLLWSETQAGVVVQDGVYSVVLGSQTAIPASVFAQNNVYLELGINGETMSPRQQITASAYSLVARTIMGSNIYENQDSGNVGVGTTNPAVKLDVSGTIQATGIKIPTGATANYVLASDASGVGTWQPDSVVVTEHDPIHTNWVRVVYAPATNSIWGAIGAEATTRANADTVLQDNIDAEATTRGNADTALQNNIDTASNTLNTAVGLRMFRSGDKMTGLLTNLVGFVGNGAGLTNIPDSGLVSTSYVRKAGDTMTGSLTVSNNVTVTLTNQAGYFVATNSITLGEMAITNWNGVGVGAGGNLSNALVNLQGATGTLNTATGTLNTAVITLNTATGTLNTATNSMNATINLLVTATNELNLATNSLQIKITTLNTATNELNLATNSLQIKITTLNTATNELNLATNSLQIKITTLNTATNELNLATNSLQTKITTLNTATNELNTRAVSWDNAVVIKTGTAGAEGIAYSNLYYFGVNSSWSNACATNSATAGGLLGIALGSASAGNPVPSSGLLLNGYCTNAWGFTAGQIIYLATNSVSGQITTTRPTGTNHIVRIVGYVVNTTNIYFNPDRTYIQILGE